MRCVTQREDGSRTRSVRLSCLSDATAVVFTRFGPEDRFTLTPMTPTRRHIDAWPSSRRSAVNAISPNWRGGTLQNRGFGASIATPPA